MTECHEFEEFLSGYLDGEMTQQNRQRVELHLDECPKCRKTFEEMSELQKSVGQLSFGEMSPQERSEIMNDVSIRTSRGLGWALYIAGIVIVLGYGAYEFAVDDEIPALIKTGIAGILVGLVLLFVSVLRQRMIASKTDKYTDVQI